MLTRDEFDDVKRRRESGESARSIAEDLNISVGYVYKIAKGKVEFKLLSRTPSDSETREIQRLLAWPVVGREKESKP